MKKNKFRFLLMVMCVSALAFTSCKKEGCTDPLAQNYSSEAEKDDGSCSYENEQDVGDSFFAKLNGVAYEYELLEALRVTATSNLDSYPFIQIRAYKTNQIYGEYIELYIPRGITPGEYTFGSDNGMYSENYSYGCFKPYASSKYTTAVNGGTFKITSNVAPSGDTKGRIKGTFSFTASEGSFGEIGAYEITEGKFNLEY